MWNAKCGLRSAECEKEQTSINQLVSSALAEKIAALTTEEYLEKRAKKGRKAKFSRVLKKVQDVIPAEEDAV